MAFNTFRQSDGFNFCRVCVPPCFLFLFLFPTCSLSRPKMFISKPLQLYSHSATHLLICSLLHMLIFSSFLILFIPISLPLHFHPWNLYTFFLALFSLLHSERNTHPERETRPWEREQCCRVPLHWSVLVFPRCSLFANNIRLKNPHHCSVGYCEPVCSIPTFDSCYPSPDITFYVTLY